MHEWWHRKPFPSEWYLLEKGYSAKAWDNSCVVTASKEESFWWARPAVAAISEGYMASKAHFGLWLPVLLRWKFNTTLFWVTVQLPYAWLKDIYLCISPFCFSSDDLLSCAIRWKLSSSESILFTSLWVMQSLLFLLGPVRERFFYVLLLPLGLFFLKAGLVLCFVDFIFFSLQSFEIWKLACVIMFTWSFPVSICLILNPVLLLHTENKHIPLARMFLL